MDASKKTNAQNEMVIIGLLSGHNANVDSNERRTEGWCFSTTTTTVQDPLPLRKCRTSARVFNSASIGLFVESPACRTEVNQRGIVVVAFVDL